jgi:hypothetical protein
VKKGVIEQPIAKLNQRGQIVKLMAVDIQQQNVNQKNLII